MLVKWNRIPDIGEAHCVDCQCFSAVCSSLPTSDSSIVPVNLVMYVARGVNHEQNETLDPGVGLGVW